MGRQPWDGQAATLAGQMKIQWTSKASSDLVRLHEHLGPVAPEAAARVVQQLAHAPDRLIDYPRIGEKLEAYEPREVRRIIVGNYEMRYEIAAGTIFILRLWHCRENRNFESEQ
ncbi:type II toxin-antitoxin system RelE/ParE family toxin [Sphingobium sp. TKS]|uniref:Plasmid stabilization protein n=8 Tax=Sphingomonadales TaxID=204457 RepID=A0A1E1F8P7_9SPHN|nr:MULTISPECIES: type II toxin-antitoxin system RelE/ParE family toxin [Sphingobium]MCB4862749.1 type II toxin-antitoxin system RelE/ParE family toxin [Sphingobium sp. PNB]BAV66801.1 plasmid stabilization protein [Sphingobium cloacae]